MDKRNSNTFLFIFLSALSAFAPVVTDMYLPTLPSMTGYFHTSVSMVQLGLTFSMLGLGLGQLFFGPLSDQHGRRSPLLVAMVLFLLATLACIFAPSIEVFVLMRFIQGSAAAGGIVLARSIAADSFSGQQLTKALAVVGAIGGVAPIASPVVGGLICKAVGWQGIFALLFFLGALLLILCFGFKETLASESRGAQSWQGLKSGFVRTLANKTFMMWTLQLASAQGILFSYIAGSPFIVQQHYGFSALSFSLFFAVNAIGMVLGAAVAVKFRDIEKCVAFSCWGMLLGSLALMLVLALQAPFAAFAVAIFVIISIAGISFAATTSLAMEAVKQDAGAGSAVLGALGFFVGSLVSPVAVLGNILIPTGLLVVAGAISSLCFCNLARRQSRQAKGSLLTTSSPKAALP